MNPRVIVINYGLGNLFSICNALNYCGAEVTVTDNADDVVAAERLVLPGVGAFRDGMAGLHEQGLIEAIRRFAQSGRPFLGICLGMQMMLDGSEEFGNHEGLGLIPGSVIPIPPTGKDEKPHKIPHVGWCAIEKSEYGVSWAGTVLQNITPRATAYFAHSFTSVPESEAHRLADAFYDGIRISAVIRKGNLYGSQFHPEKSGETGLSILKNFLGLENEQRC